MNTIQKRPTDLDAIIERIEFLITISLERDMRDLKNEEHNLNEVRDIVRAQIVEQIFKI